MKELQGTRALPVRLQVLAGRYDAKEESLVFSYSEPNNSIVPAYLRLSLNAVPGETVTLGSIMAEHRGELWKFDENGLRLTLDIALAFVLKVGEGSFMLAETTHHCDWSRQWGSMLSGRTTIEDPQAWSGQLRVGRVECVVHGWWWEGDELVFSVSGKGPISLKLYEWQDLSVDVAASEKQMKVNPYRLDADRLAEDPLPESRANRPRALAKSLPRVHNGSSANGVVHMEKRLEGRLGALQQQLIAKEQELARVLEVLNKTQEEQQRLRREHQEIQERLEQIQGQDQPFFSRVFGRMGSFLG